MANVYNKVNHFTNGTLIGNWYEEQRLREHFYVSKKIPSKDFLQKTMDNIVISKASSSHNSTFDRIIGLRNDKAFVTTNSTYGHFSQPETKYKKESIEDSRDLNTYVKPSEKDFTPARESLRRKVIAAAINKGWLGFRKLKLFLKSLSKRHDGFIPKEDLKYLFGNFGVEMEEMEVEYVVSLFHNNKNEIDYEELLNSFITITEERMNKILLFIQQLKSSNSLLKDILINMLKPSIHPSFLSKQSTEKEIFIEYSFSLESNPFLAEEDYIQLLCEINLCVQDDKAFNEMLQACGFLA